MLKKLLVHRTENTYVQGFRYLFAGAAGFMADLFVLFILTHYFDVFYIFSAMVGFTAGITITYLVSVKWVFGRRSAYGRRKEFAIFSLIGVIGLLITLASMWLLTDILHIYFLISKIVATVLVYFWNFSARKKLLFDVRSDDVAMGS